MTCPSALRQYMLQAQDSAGLGAHFDVVPIHSMHMRDSSLAALARKVGGRASISITCAGHSVASRCDFGAQTTLPTRFFTGAHTGESRAWPRGGDGGGEDAGVGTAVFGSGSDAL